ncbi:hypothetical protein [Paenibacillus periandrae]|uniref:hypothetical protein n=1 Tax=Paenibacillus periandrae TaxID=1761741 RepID=UPI001F0994CF|nr:hypothetical protein [Paenibacillus periandrae]
MILSLTAIFALANLIVLIIISFIYVIKESYKESIIVHFTKNLFMVSSSYLILAGTWFVLLTLFDSVSIYLVLVAGALCTVIFLYYLWFFGFSSGMTFF